MNNNMTELASDLVGVAILNKTQEDKIDVKDLAYFGVADLAYIYLIRDWLKQYTPVSLQGTDQSVTIARRVVMSLIGIGIPYMLLKKYVEKQGGGFMEVVKKVLAADAAQFLYDKSMGIDRSL